MSGVGSEVGEMEELLSSMKEARDHREREAVEKRKVIKDKEAGKERLGAVIREQALKRRAERNSSSEDGKEESDTPRKRPRLGAELKESLDSELRQFTETLARGDQERNRIDQERLTLDRERFEADKLEREQEREQCKKEREAAQKLELQKFRAMVELLGKGVPRNAARAEAASSLRSSGRLRYELCAPPLRALHWGMFCFSNRSGYGNLLPS